MLYRFIMVCCLLSCISASAFVFNFISFCVVIHSCIMEMSFMLFCCIFFPSLENAVVGENLIGAFIKEIKDGVFLLYLDSKQFLADSVIDFPRDEEFDLSPRVQLGCRSGFRRISSPGKAGPNSQGCGMSHF